MMLRYEDVSLTRSGLRHKVRLVTEKAGFPSRDHDTIRLNCQGIIQGKDQAFPILATSEIGRNLVAEPRRQPIYKPQPSPFESIREYPSQGGTCMSESA